MLTVVLYNKSTVDNMARLRITIENIREGFACNSSSSHSMLLLEKEERPGTTEYNEFGWEAFTIDNWEGKSNYLHAILREALSRILGLQGAEQVLTSLGFNELAEGTYVDHQSCFDLPHDWSGQTVNIEFVQDLIAFFKQDNLVILGGNDNDGSADKIENSQEFVLPLAMLSSIPSIARKDLSNNTWTIFSRETGMKIRFSFEEPLTPQSSKGGLPDLVDVKITDWCDVGCVMCYQGSTSKGGHADDEYLKQLADTLGETHVFEVAIGGGEPTAHPGFKKFVEALRAKNVIPNLTTRNLEFLKTEDQIIEQLGAVAYSVETLEEAQEFLNLKLPKSTKRNIQIVDGMVTHTTFLAICKAAWNSHATVTLLGYKTAGRGALWQKNLLNTNWVKAYNSDGFQRWGFRIDTALVRQYRTQIESLGASYTSYHSEEGAWSCYIDAVSQQMGASSYVPTSEDLTNPANFLKTFQKLSVDACNIPNVPIQIV